MKMSNSLVVALAMVMAASVFAEDRGAAQRQVKPVANNTERELDYNPIVVDDSTTLTIISDTNGDLIGVQVEVDDGEEIYSGLTLVEQELEITRKVPRSIDTTLKYESIHVDDGVTATMISDANGNLIGATASVFDGVNLISSSTSDNNVIMAMKNVRIMSVGDQTVALRRDETTGLWDTAEVINFPFAITDVTTDDTDDDIPDTVKNCSVSIAMTDCTAIIAHSCGGGLTIYILCREALNGSACKGKWALCGRFVL